MDFYWDRVNEKAIEVAEKVLKVNKQIGLPIKEDIKEAFEKYFEKNKIEYHDDPFCVKCNLLYSEGVVMSIVPYNGSYGLYIDAGFICGLDDEYINELLSYRDDNCTTVYYNGAFNRDVVCALYEECDGELTYQQIEKSIGSILKMMKKVECVFYLSLMDSKSVEKAKNEYDLLCVDNEVNYFDIISREEVFDRDYTFDFEDEALRKALKRSFKETEILIKTKGINNKFGAEDYMTMRVKNFLKAVELEYRYENTLFFINTDLTKEFGVEIIIKPYPGKFGLFARIPVKGDVSPKDVPNVMFSEKTAVIYMGIYDEWKNKHMYDIVKKAEERIMEFARFEE